ncbi:hypothetical protein [Pedobacter panaciterrae]|uniref:hypothetical protein n=1 Tax=Pedobacter panaciterrae TaxID=363849 RepID=UPI0025928150|nr:hypothetical protein [uncultured Pedobacter sp.]
MGYRAKVNVRGNEEGRDLPLFPIQGTDFIVDIQRGEFREAANPSNRIIISGVKEEYGFSFFYYDTRTKNVYAGSPADAPSFVALIIVPPLKQLDPVGLARRQGLPDDYHTRRQHREKEFMPQIIRNRPEKDNPIQTKSRLKI